MASARWLTLIALFCAITPTHAQMGSQWRLFKTADGLAESMAVSVSFSLRSNVWIRHSTDLSTITSFNGYQFRRLPAPAPGQGRIFESRAGQLWTVSAEGLQEFRNGSWITHPVKEIRAEYQTNLMRHARSMSLAPLRQGRVLFLVSDRLLEFTHESPQPHIQVVRHVQQTSFTKFNDLVMAPDGAVWITGDTGLLRATGIGRSGVDITWETFRVPQELGIRDLQQPMLDSQGGVTMIADSAASQRRVAVHFDGQKWRILGSPRESLRQAWADSEGRFWAISISTLFLFDPETREFQDVEEVSAGRFFEVAVEPGGAFWIATSDGLFRHAPLSWKRMNSHPPTAFIEKIVLDPEGRIWGLAPGGVTRIDAAPPLVCRPTDPIGRSFPPGRAGFALRKGALVINADDGLLRFDPDDCAFHRVPHPAGGFAQALGTTRDGEALVRVQLADRDTFQLELFDGDTFRPFPGRTPAAPAGTEAHLVFETSTGDLWLATSSGIFIYREREWQKADFLEDAGVDMVTCFGDVGDGRIWIGTRDRLIEIAGQSWNVVRSGLDRINAIVRTRDGSVWVASTLGVFRFHRGTWLANSPQEGTASNALLEDHRGRLWAGALRGWALYNPEADIEPPQTQVLRHQRGSDGVVTISFGGRDKWRQTSAEHLLFSHRIDEHEWSPFGLETSASFTDLSPGKHYFQVRSMDRNGNIDPAPVLWEFEIPVPWYQETRLVFISVAALMGILFFAWLAFNRHRQLVRSYAEVEHMVALRTKQLQEANAQLLHSQKMNALGTLAAGIAHDFNNILSIIKGSAQIIESDLDDKDKIRTRIARIKTVVDQGSGIVKAMLGFSRPAEKERVPCQLNGVVEETIRLLGDRFLREVEVKFEPGNVPAQIELAKSSLQQILLNFIFNAADACSGPGQIVVRTGVAPLVHGQPVLAPAPAPQHVFVSVTDNGCGIAPEILPRIFEPFFTTKALSSRRGTGLGLSMVYQIAQELQWGLTVETTPGKGSTFTVVLPAATTLSSPPAGLEPAPPVTVTSPSTRS